MSSRRSLWPREHGAYAQLAAPIAAALALAMPSAAALLLAIAALSAFLANEPLLVVLGHRGARLQAAEGARARVRLIVLGAIALGGAAAGLAIAGAPTLRMAAIALVPAVALVVLAWRRGQHSLAGELVAAAALPAASAPVAVASVIDLRTACLLWAAWSLGYASSVVAVHRMIARHRRRATPTDHAIALGLGAVLAGACVASAEVSAGAVSLPLLALAFVIVVRPPSARHVRAVGVALVVASAASIAVALVTT